MAKVSIMKLIQRSSTALRANSSYAAAAAARAATNVMMTAAPPQIFECAQKMGEMKREK
jgi:hypothetical protein